MNKKLIQELLNDDETRRALAATLGVGDGPMRGTLSALNVTLDEAELITIQVSDHMWVRGEYVRTEADGRVTVDVNGYIGPYKFLVGKRVDLVIKGEGETT